MTFWPTGPMAAPSRSVDLVVGLVLMLIPAAIPPLIPSGSCSTGVRVSGTGVGFLGIGPTRRGSAGGGQTATNFTSMLPRVALL